MGETPLEVSARWGHVKMVEFLLLNCEFTKDQLKKGNAKAINHDIKNLFSYAIKGKINSRNNNNKLNNEDKAHCFYCNFLC